MDGNGSGNAVEAPVDYSKSKFSIEFLLDKSAPSTSSAQPTRSETPDSSVMNGHSRGYSNNGDNNADRPKRPRTAFTSAQIKTLEAEFDKNKYLSVGKRVELSRQLGLSQQQLKVWYQNRRTKWKRKYANDLESVAQQYYSSLGIPGSRPMLIGDRLWIFNAAQMSANEALMNDHPNFRRNAAAQESRPLMPSLLPPSLSPSRFTHHHPSPLLAPYAGRHNKEDH